MSQAIQVLDFWFGSPDSIDFGKPQTKWFTKDPQFDREVDIRFRQLYHQAANGLFDDWKDQPHTCLALILLLDQFPRNLFRDRPAAFTTDWEALSVAQHAISQGYDLDLLPVQRWFIYLPFEHSENIEHQYLAVKLFQQLNRDPDSAIAIESAMLHLEIIERFGRFPHRNAILGRVSTPEEEEFLKQPGSHF